MHTQNFITVQVPCCSCTTFQDVHTTKIDYEQCLFRHFMHRFRTAIFSARLFIFSHRARRNKVAKEVLLVV